MMPEKNGKAVSSYSPGLPESARATLGLDNQINQPRRGCLTLGFFKRLIFHAAFCAALLLSSSPIFASPPAHLDLRAYGAAADGRTLDTTPINNAIKTLSAQGGGTLYFPPGTYLTGSIHLLSNVTLQLAPGATILGSTDIAHYPKNAPPRPGSLEYARHALINARGQTNIAIIGQGTINGQGNNPNFTKKDMIASGMNKTDAYTNRPYALSFIECKRVTVQGIHLENIAYWCQHYLDCDDVLVTGVSVDSKNHDANNDGIDIDGSRNVRVSDSRFNSGDDAICLKAGYKDCENITITNCTASSNANAIKFGTATAAGFKNIAITNCAIHDTHCAGLALEIVDGGTLDGVTISNIAMRDVGTAIFVRLGNMARKWAGITPRPPGLLRNVTITNITATIWPKPGDTRPLSCSITGLPGHPVENISINNLRLITSYKVPPKKARELLAKEVPEKEKDYPEFAMFGELPSSGLYIRHAANIDLNNLSIITTTPDARPLIVADDIENLRLDGLSAAAPRAQAQDPAALPALPALIFTNVRHALLTRIDMPAATSPILQLDKQCTDILLDAHLPKNITAITHALVQSPPMPPCKGVSEDAPAPGSAGVPPAGLRGTGVPPVGLRGMGVPPMCLSPCTILCAPPTGGTPVPHPHPPATFALAPAQ